MITKIGKVGTTNHVFKSEKEFLILEDWILQIKGKEFHESWKLLEESDLASISVYNEWLEAEGVTHTFTVDE